MQRKIFANFIPKKWNYIIDQLQAMEKAFLSKI